MAGRPDAVDGLGEGVAGRVQGRGVHRTVRSTPERGARAGYDGDERRTGSKIHLAVDTLGHLLALRVIPAAAQDRDQVAALAEAVLAATGEAVELAYVDRASRGSAPEEAAAAHGIALEVIWVPEAKHGAVLLPRRWVVERSFAWTGRFHRLVRDSERPPGTIAGFHVVAFACLIAHRSFTPAAQRP